MLLLPALLLLPAALGLPQDLGGLLGGLLGGDRGGGRSLQDRVRNIINNPVIQNRVLNSELNPCPGKLPSQCTCNNGVDFVPASFLDLNQGNPCGRGARPQTCTCPSGQIFDAEEVAEGVARRYNIATCSCPDGTTITANSFIAAAVPLIQDILG